MMSLNSKNATALDLPARFMALSILSFSIAMLSSPWALSLMQEQFNGFSLLALVHLMTLGFIGSMIIGASYQLVPVALQAPLFSVTIGRMSFSFYAGGLLLFLAGLVRGWLPGLSIGGTLLGVAFALYITVILGTFIRAPRRDAIAWHIVVAATFSGAGMLMGLLLAFNKSSGFLGGRLLDILAAHIVVMLVGWVALTFMGVACKLIGMFTLAEKHFSNRLLVTQLALTGIGVVLVAVRFMLGLPAFVGVIGAAMILGGFAVFANQVSRMYRRRMRRSLDIHVPFTLAAIAFMLFAAASLLAGLVMRVSPLDPLWVATCWLAIFGVTATAIQGFFYKIAIFLVWLKRYAPIAGRQRVPKLEDLYRPPVGMIGFWLWSLAIAGGWIVLMLEQPWLPFVGVALVAGASCFVFNVVNIARHWISGTRPLSKLIAKRIGVPERV